METTYRLVDRKAAPALLDLLTRVRPKIVRLSNRHVLRCITKDAVRFDDVVCMGAFREDRLIGYVLVGRDWHRYKKRKFLMRHPSLLVSLLYGELRRRFARKLEPADEAQTGFIDSEVEVESYAPYAWWDTGRDIAKMIYIGVDPSARAKGVGTGLHRATLGHLKSKGLRRLDATIAYDNHASMKVFRRVGWTVVPRPYGYYAFMELDRWSGED